MKRKSHPLIGLRPVASATGILIALLAAAPAAVAQTTSYRDTNDTTAGFGTALGIWDTAASNWTTDATGVAAPIAWVNDAGTPNSAILDFVGNTGGPGALTLATDLNLGGLEVKGLGNSTSGFAGPVLAINESRTITFGAGAVVTIEDRGIFLSDLNIRAQASTATTSTLNLNGFTKKGAGTLQLTARAQTTAGATAVVNLTGTVNVDAGQLALITVGGNSDTTRTINVGSAVFNLAPGTVLSVMNPFNYTAAGSIPATGMAAFGEIAGSGTVRGERNGSSNTLTLTATGITPGTDGTIGTLTIADLTGTNTLNQPADGATGFSFASLATGGLKFDLAAPGSSDRLVFSGLSTVNLAGLAFSHFDFNQLAGFGAGTYTLVSGLPSIVEGSLGETTGTIDGRTVTLAINGSSLELTISGAGPDSTAPAAPSLTLLASSDTGSSGTDRITNDTTPTLRITLAGSNDAAPVAGDVVKLQQAAVEVASATLREGDITAGYIDLTSPILAPGSLSFTATVTDAAGNLSASSEALGILLDTTAPLISVIGSDTSVGWGSAYSDEGATAADPEGGAVAVVTVNPVDTSTSGVYTVTYRATDAAGNTALATRTVIVSIANPAVPGADGHSPLMKYAFGATSPSDSVQGPVLHSTDTTLSLTAVVRTNDPAVIVSAEAVNELTGTWGTGGTVNESFASDQSALPPNTERRVYTVDINGASKKFLRLKARLTPPASTTQPNFIFIIADDLGIGDLGAYGATRISTPQIDRLAREGLRATQAHASASVCTPSRYAVLTGENYWRAPAWEGQSLIRADQPTIARTLSAAGYATGYFGKWHLGWGDSVPGEKRKHRAGGVDWTAETLPNGVLETGYDTYFGTPWSANEPPFVFVRDRAVVGRDPADPISIVGPEVEKYYGYGVSRGGAAAHAARPLESIDPLVTREALGFIEAHKDRPFYLHLAFVAPHVPIASEPQYKGRSGTGPYGDMIVQMDDCVGRILDALDSHGIADNTFIIFTSDNGAILNRGVRGTGHRSNLGLQGQKTDAWQGGVNVPFLARWPRKIPAGSTTDRLIALNDFFATAAAAAGFPIPTGAARDSINQLPVLTDPAAPAARTEMTYIGITQPQVALRSGDWVYLPGQGSFGATTDPNGWAMQLAELGAVHSDYAPDGSLKPEAPLVQLYNLSVDPGQQLNFASQHPEKVGELDARLRQIRGRPTGAPPAAFD
jgi:arylsulfatase A-like enzyme